MGYGLSSDADLRASDICALAEMRRYRHGMSRRPKSAPPEFPLVIGLRPLML